MSARNHEPMLQQGFVAFGQGQFETAWKCFDQVLREAPGNVAALLNGGSVLAQLGRPDEALDCFRRVPAHHPRHLDALCNQGWMLLSLGRHDEALASLSRALALHRQHPRALQWRAETFLALGRPDAAAIDLNAALKLEPQNGALLQLLGHALTSGGQHLQALAPLDRLLRMDPDNLAARAARAHALSNLGRHEEALEDLNHALRTAVDDDALLVTRAYSLGELGRYDEALEILDRVLAQQPRHATALDNRGVILDRLRRHDEALDCFDRALAQSPQDIAILLNRAVALQSLHRLEETLEASTRVLERQPAHAHALRLQGCALLGLHRPEQALTCFEQVLQTASALPPAEEAEAQTYRGLALTYLDRNEEARHCIDRALQLDPDNRSALRYQGVVLDSLKHREQATACFDRILELEPDCAESRFNRSLVRLALGDYHGGFQDMEARWRTPAMRSAELRTGAPVWLGQTPLQGRSLLLYHEQGLGDIIQFSRYAPLAARAGARVLLRVPGQLRGLMASLEGVARVFTDHDPLPEHDLLCPLMSLPLAFGTTLENVPARTPYLRAQPERIAGWSARLKPPAGRRVGLVWAGRQEPPVNYKRDMSLELLRPLLELDADFISLQKEVPPTDALRLPELPQLLPLGSSLSDFADTAALIENLDLVIAVDSSVAHLAGALGKPVWLLNRYASCWRWLETRGDSPWYPGLRIFRQPTLGNWNAVVDAACTALAAWLQERPRAGIAREVSEEMLS